VIQNDDFYMLLLINQLFLCVIVGTKAWNKMVGEQNYVHADRFTRSENGSLGYIYICSPPLLWTTFCLKNKSYNAWCSVFCCFLMHIRNIFTSFIPFKESLYFKRHNSMILWSCLLYENAFFAFIGERFQSHKYTLNMLM